MKSDENAPALWGWLTRRLSLNSIICGGFPAALLLALLVFSPGSPIMMLAGAGLGVGATAFTWFLGISPSVFAFVGMFALKRELVRNKVLMSSIGADLLCALGLAVTVWLSIAYVAQFSPNGIAKFFLGAATFAFMFFWLFPGRGKVAVSVASRISVMAAAMFAATMVAAPWADKLDIRFETQGEAAVSGEVRYALTYDGEDPAILAINKDIVLAEIRKDVQLDRIANRQWLFTAALAAPDLSQNPDMIVIDVPTADYKVFCQRDEGKVEASLTHPNRASSLTQALIDRLCRIRFKDGG